MPATVNPEKTTSTFAENTFLSKPSVERRKKSASALGAPSQLNQTSRKGKRAWRKNVDIEDVEDVLEGLRAEERVTGYVLGLFQLLLCFDYHETKIYAAEEKR